MVPCLISEDLNLDIQNPHNARLRSMRLQTQGFTASWDEQTEDFLEARAAASISSKEQQRDPF